MLRRAPVLGLLIILLLSHGTTQAKELPVEGICNFVLAQQLGLFHPSNVQAVASDRPGLGRRIKSKLEELLSLGHVHRGREDVINRNRLPLPEIDQVKPVSLPTRIETSLHGISAALQAALEPLLGIQFSRFPHRDAVYRLHRSMYAEAARQLLAQVAPSTHGGRGFLNRLDRELRREDLPLLHDFTAIKHFIELSSGAEPDVKNWILWQLEELMVKGSNLNRLNAQLDNNRVTLRETSMQLAARSQDARTAVTLARIRLSSGLVYDLRARAEFNYVVTDEGQILLLTSVEGYRNARAPHERPLDVIEVGHVQIDLVQGKTGRK